MAWYTPLPSNSDPPSKYKYKNN